MSKYIRIVGTAVILAVAAITLLGPDPAMAASAAQIDRDADAALWKLYETTPSAKTLAASAKAVLVFPNIVKAGFMVGAQYGDGALLVKARRSVTTTSSQRRTASRPACSRSGTRCSS